MTEFDEHFMRMALREAEKAAADGEVPTGCVIVEEPASEDTRPAEVRILGRAHNQAEGLQDATAHAEMLALSSAFTTRGNWRLTNTRLYVTKEPCPMCAGAIVLARVSTVVWGLDDPKRGGDTEFKMFTHPGINHHPKVVRGVLEDACREVLQSFFKARRAAAKVVMALVLVLAAVGANAATNLEFNAGADLRIRQEIMHNVTGLPGGHSAVMQVPYKKNINHIRIRPRAWFSVDGANDFGTFKLYARVVDEFREHIIDNGVRRKDRAYNFPDEVLLDNLYLEGVGLFDGFLDFTVGRQDMFDGRHSVIGLDRIFLDGSAFDGSRSCFGDMIRAKMHFTEDSALELFALYDNSRNDIAWGTPQSRGRALNTIRPGDEPDMDEWGGGGVWSSNLFDKRLPYKLYVVHKRNTAYHTVGGVKMPSKQLTAFGANFAPQLTDEFSLEFEGTAQEGDKGNGAACCGFMGYAAMDFHPDVEAAAKPFARLSSYYLSGDKDHGTGRDSAWDPMWARAPCDSELFQYGTLYGLGYWSNMIYTKLTLGFEFSPAHRLVAYSGPMYAAAQDYAGHADGEGDSMYKGWLSSVRYDFPLLPKGICGERFNIFGHVMAEHFQPGDYYDSVRAAWFFRWEIIFKF